MSYGCSPSRQGPTSTSSAHPCRRQQTKWRTWSRSRLPETEALDTTTSTTVTTADKRVQCECGHFPRTSDRSEASRVVSSRQRHTLRTVLDESVKCFRNMSGAAHPCPVGIIETAVTSPSTRSWTWSVRQVLWYLCLFSLSRCYLLTR